jgi:hypothetical protein
MVMHFVKEARRLVHCALQVDIFDLTVTGFWQGMVSSGTVLTADRQWCLWDSSGIAVTAR